MNNPTYLSAHKIYSGKRWYEDSTLLIENNIVTAIIQTTSLNFQPTQVYPFIIPALIDLQIYGAGGQLLSMHPNKEALYLLRAYCINGGAYWFQPTVATNSNKIIFDCVDAIKAYWADGGKGCIGLHVEGPWINDKKRGAHLTQFIYSPSLNEVKELLDYGKGIITMITLAPEICNKEIVDLIHSYGVVVSAGHSDATYNEAMEAFDGGIKTATHLFNAMSPLQHRSPGMVGAIFNHPSVMCSIVPDGYHVDFSAIKIAKKQLGNRLFAITDAVTNTGHGPYPHQLNGDKYEANGILSGSALTMLSCVLNLNKQVGIELGEAINMCSVYPAQVLKTPGISGIIEPGYQADYICLNNDLVLTK